MKITNPIIPGFNPDPSIIRVGKDYYIATSTFEWFPGVMIYHSRDLANWNLIARPLNRFNQLDMLGEGNSRGIYAPCLSYSDGMFYLVYTDVKQISVHHNYLVTTEDIRGEWSDPVYLNSRGIDPSLFHDDDGRKWLVQCIGTSELLSAFTSEQDFFPLRVAKNAVKTISNYVWYKWRMPFLKNPISNGIALQEFDAENKKLCGDSKRLFKPHIGITEGPHLYKRGGYYHLLVAEGGTGFGHCVTMARSKKIHGPYEIHPQNPVLGSKKSNNPLQKAGHADLVETPDGETYMVHLCSRPLKKRTGSVLGRETAIQKVHWCEDGWLRMANGSRRPELNIDIPGDADKARNNSQTIHYDFSEDDLPMDFQWLRSSKVQDAFSLTARKGYLRMIGRDFLSSNFEVSLLARRQQDFNYTAETKVEFEPNHLEHSAGLVVMYHNRIYYYLRIGIDKKKNKIINITRRFKETVYFNSCKDIILEKNKPVYLKAEVHEKDLQFYYAMDGRTWEKTGKTLNMLRLCDEKTFGFTGAFVGMHCVDQVTRENYADFKYFSYSAIKETA